MTFQGALINHRGSKFGIIRVKPSVLNSTKQVAEVQAFGRRAWGQIPIVLADNQGRIKGPTNSVRLLSSVSDYQIPWRQWSVQ